MSDLHLSDFDFELPPELIAQTPPEVRGASRLMHLDRAGGAVSHRVFADLPSLLRADDLLVLNDTRVFPARLLGERLPGGGAVECLLVARIDGPDAPGHGHVWRALVSPGARVKPGTRLRFVRDGVVLEGEVLERAEQARIVRLSTPDGSPAMAAIERIGHMPLPPYIKRADADSDRSRYQTVYARHQGSIAAPTAGLHFTPETFAALDARGIERVTVTLHVGYGTFQPVRVDRIADHRMAHESYHVSDETAAALTRARQAGRRIVAVGTTSTRTLESLAITPAGQVLGGRGETALFISPGYRFQLVQALVTNFHVPRSSLLMLVSALAGLETMRAAYREAIAERYRFYSYGDAMFID